MGGLSKRQMEAMSEAMKQEHGASADEVENVLKRTFTVGELKNLLNGVDESLPVELEVVIEVNEEGDCATQPGLAIHSYQVREGDEGFPRFTLVGAPPQNAEAYAEAFELDLNPQ